MFSGCFLYYCGKEIFDKVIIDKINNIITLYLKNDEEQFSSWVSWALAHHFVTSKSSNRLDDNNIGLDYIDIGADKMLLRKTAHCCGPNLHHRPSHYHIGFRKPITSKSLRDFFAKIADFQSNPEKMATAIYEAHRDEGMFFKVTPGKPYIGLEWGGVNNISTPEGPQMTGPAALYRNVEFEWGKIESVSAPVAQKMIGRPLLVDYLKHKDIKYISTSEAQRIERSYSLGLGGLEMTLIKMSACIAFLVAVPRIAEHVTNRIGKHRDWSESSGESASYTARFILLFFMMDLQTAVVTSSLNYAFTLIAKQLCGSSSKRVVDNISLFCTSASMLYLFLNTTNSALLSTIPMGNLFIPALGLGSFFLASKVALWLTDTACDKLKLKETGAETVPPQHLHPD